MKKFLKNIFWGILILIILGGVSTLSLFIYFGNDLPDYEILERYEAPVTSRMHSADGHLFAEYARENRSFVPIGYIPPKLIKTFIAVEDKNFYDHVGFDWSGMLRALVTNIKNILKGSRRKAGGSTITQQVAKNILLSNEQTFSRKIKEAILSFRIEHTFSKEKILELYLNEIYLGANTYGVASAALHYFGKALDELSDDEIAFLAAIPKAPNNYHPKRHPQRAQARRDFVLRRMMEEGILTTAEAIKAKKRPLEVIDTEKEEKVDAEYFAEEVRRFTLQKYGQKALYEGGLSIRTTLDSRYQKIADQTLRKGLIRYDRKQGWRGPVATMPLEDWIENLQKVAPTFNIKPWELALTLSVDAKQAEIGLKDGTKGIIPLANLEWARQSNGLKNDLPDLGPKITSPDQVLSPGDVIIVSRDTSHGENPPPVYSLEQIPEINGAIIVMDPHTGRVLAMDGGFRFSKSQFNRATQAQRQIGSAFKSILYLAALEVGFSPSSPILDAPIVLDIGREGELWKPKNIDKKFHGVNTLRKALEKSYNVSSLRTAQDVGMAKVEEVAKRLGVHDHLPHELTMVLGSGVTTLLKVTLAHAAFVNGGKRIDPTFIDQIQDRHGSTIYRADKRICTACENQEWRNQFPPQIEDNREQIINPVHAYQIVSMLEGAVKNGTGKRAGVKGAAVGGKTGTTNDYKDTWFIGFTPDLVIGVYIGYDQPHSLGRYQTGATVPAPVFRDFLESALDGSGTGPFRIPPEAKLIRVNTKTGLPTKVQNKSTHLEAFTSEQLSSLLSTRLKNNDVGGIY